MRTTLTIDDPVIAILRQTAAESGKSFKQVINETLRAGLDRRTAEPATPYHLTPATLGQARPGIDLDKALDLVGEFEDQAITNDLEAGRRSWSMRIY